MRGNLFIVFLDPTLSSYHLIPNLLALLRTLTQGTHGISSGNPLPNSRGCTVRGSWNEGLLFQKIQSTFEWLVRSGRHGSQLLWALEPDWGL